MKTNIHIRKFDGTVSTAPAHVFPQHGMVVALGGQDGKIVPMWDTTQVKIGEVPSTISIDEVGKYADRMVHVGKNNSGTEIQIIY